MSDKHQTYSTKANPIRRLWEHVGAGLMVIIVLGMILGMKMTLQAMTNTESSKQSAQVGTLEERQLFFPIIYNSGGSNEAPDMAEIFSISGYDNIEQSEPDFQIGLRNHTEATAYDIYLADSANMHKICADVVTDVSGDSDVSCDLSAVGGGLLPPGLYDLFSTVSGTLAPKVAIADLQVEIVATPQPAIAEIFSISGYDNIKQTETDFQVGLRNHVEADAYDIYLADSAKSYRICENVVPNSSGNSDVSCDLSAITGGLLPLGLYDLYSTVGGTISPLIAVAPEQVQIDTISMPPVPAPQIWSISGYSNIEQTETNFQVYLADHSPETAYDIYLVYNFSDAYKICADVVTNAVGDSDASCDLRIVTGGLLPPGLYDLVSTVSGTISPLVAIAPDQVQIVATPQPALKFVSGNTSWAVGSPTQIELVDHRAADEPFTLALFDKNLNFVKNIATGLPATTEPIDWMVDDVAGCDVASGTPCYLRTLKSDSSVIAELAVFINQPELILVPGTQPYAQGQTLRILLKAHTPNSVYDVFIQGGSLSAPLKLGTTLETNAYGDTPYAIAWTVPAGCGSGWENGMYDIVSKPEGQAIEIAKQENVEFFTQLNPYLTVDGGNIWPTGSTISIQLHLHYDNTTHYLEFDQNRIPTSNADDTFMTSNCGFAVVDYEIPLDTASGIYKIVSYLDSDNTKQAEFEVTVNTAEIISLSGYANIEQTETDFQIELRNHTPSTAYQIYLADSANRYKICADLLTDSTGQRDISCDLSAVAGGLPPGLYDLYSTVIGTVSPPVAVADFQVEIVAAP
ncbi:MAG: hypothetical protein KDJ52_23315 [Anaerolineae bacterium]|nr:hypothetical protein [Anaerolineae bacterium]